MSATEASRHPQRSRSWLVGLPNGPRCSSWEPRASERRQPLCWGVCSRSAPREHGEWGQLLGRGLGHLWFCAVSLAAALIQPQMGWPGGKVTFWALVLDSWLVNCPWPWSTLSLGFLFYFSPLFIGTLYTLNNISLLSHAGKIFTRFFIWLLILFLVFFFLQRFKFYTSEFGAVTLPLHFLPCLERPSL